MNCFYWIACLFFGHDYGDPFYDSERDCVQSAICKRCNKKSVVGGATRHEWKTIGFKTECEYDYSTLGCGNGAAMYTTEVPIQRCSRCGEGA